MMLCFGLKELEVYEFSNVNFVGDTDDHKSTSGHVLIFWGGILSWASKKQICVARHIMEVEYIACSFITTYAAWIKRFINNLKVKLVNRPINVFCYNKSAISLIKSGTNSSKGKHINVNYPYL